MLENFKDKFLQSDAEKKEVTQAYWQRKDNLAKISTGKDLGLPEKRAETTRVSPDELGRVFVSVEGDGLSYHTFEDIGRYTTFPDNMFKRMFPSKAFGNYEEDEYKWNNTYGIMTREEGLRITNDLA